MPDWNTSLGCNDFTRWTDRRGHIRGAEWRQQNDDGCRIGTPHWAATTSQDGRIVEVTFGEPNGDNRTMTDAGLEHHTGLQRLHKMDGSSRSHSGSRMATTER